MSVSRFKPYAPDVQAVVRVDEALPPDHPVHVFVDLIQGISLDHFVVPAGPKGEKPYHPHALFGVLDSEEIADSNVAIALAREVPLLLVPLELPYRA